MDAEFAPFLAELDAAVYVIDCLPNMWAPEIAERTEPFIAALRSKRPATPILLVEDRTYKNAFLVAATRDRHAASRAALKEAYDRMATARVPQLYYLTGEELLGTDSEATVENNSHPTDLGFMRQADRFEAALRPLLQAK